MRALAEFAMRGRAQAIGVAVLGIVLSVFVWISAGVVGLVVLRRGALDAFIVLGWALLAAIGIWLWQGDPGPVTALIATAIAAYVLRWSRSWPLALIAIVITGLMSGFVVSLVGAEFVTLLVLKLNQFIAENIPAEQAAVLGQLNAVQVSGLLALRSTCLAVIALLMARWWQAALYNPGGFRDEFHRLRLPLPLAAGLIAGGALTALLGEDYQWWSIMFALPFVVSGFALIHGMVGIKGWGRGPLIALYLAWIVLWEVVTATLLLLALIDSWWDFRERLRARSQ
ncbi:MAG: hypothetical protein JWM78_1440 [Verrucomicrobiaceae bacterium]|nr:hypothetical protein [Verrucomicrobiaceae bacterium]